jgi:Zn-dependent protease
MTNLLSSFTLDAQRVINNAHRIAKQYRQSVIIPEYLLLGLLQLSDCHAELVLRKCHINVTNLKTRLEATIKLQANQEMQSQPEIGYSNRRVKLSNESTAIIQQSLAEAQENNLDYVDTRLLVLGMLRQPDYAAGAFLLQYGVTLDKFREQAGLAEQMPINLPRFRLPAMSFDGLFFGVSPIFVGLVLLTVAAGYLTYAGIGNSRFGVFLFVTGGWIISVALHEFGHALAAYWGGDDSVAHQGYLTLNPLKYTHPFLSIFLPLLFLVMGGIGLPGGAVYINPLALKSNASRTLVSAAGPMATLLCGAILALPFAFEWYSIESLIRHFEFWAGVAFLAFLQITALFINLLPIPGLDGFGIMVPFLPPDTAYRLNLLRPFGFFILYALFFIDSPINDFFWQEIWRVTSQISPDLAALAWEGFELFRFWT